MDTAETSRMMSADPALQGAEASIALGDWNGAFVEDAAEPEPKSGRGDKAIPVSLLLEATRTAGMFQRSALGHLDHHAWLDRVQSDGQRLIDVLTQMGFRARSERAPKR